MVNKEYARGYIEALAATRGWSAAALEGIRAGALLMIAVHGRDEQVRASTVAQLGGRLLPVGPIREVPDDCRSKRTPRSSPCGCPGVGRLDGASVQPFRAPRTLGK
jgi:hypothetical protein